MLFAAEPPEHSTVEPIFAYSSVARSASTRVIDPFANPFCSRNWSSVCARTSAIALPMPTTPPFGALAAFQRDLIQALGGAAGASFGGEPFEIFEQLDGYPVLIRRLHEGAVESETRFDVPERVGADEARYAPPADYARRVEPGSAP